MKCPYCGSDQNTRSSHMNRDYTHTVMLRCGQCSAMVMATAETLTDALRKVDAAWSEERDRVAQ